MLNPHVGGMARITATGADVIEGNLRPPIAINIHNPRTINVTNSSNFQVGDGNIQVVLQLIKTLIEEIDKSSGTRQQKEEAKSLLKRFIEHPLVTAIVGDTVAGLMK